MKLFIDGTLEVLLVLSTAGNVRWGKVARQFRGVKLIKIPTKSDRRRDKKRVDAKSPKNNQHSFLAHNSSKQTTIVLLCHNVAQLSQTEEIESRDDTIPLPIRYWS